MTTRAPSLRKPVTYRSNESEAASTQRVRSSTDLNENFRPRKTDKFVQSPQEQLERVRRLTVDDAERILSAFSANQIQPPQKEKKRKSRFGSFSLKLRAKKRTESIAETPLERFKSAASKFCDKFNWMKPRNLLDLDPTPSRPVISSPLQRSHSITNSLSSPSQYHPDAPPKRLGRQNSVSSFNSVATAPEYLANTSYARDVPRKPAPSRPASLAGSPAAEYGMPLSRAVLGPVPRGVTGPRLSDCQTLRVSGHVRQTFTRTLQQRGSFGNAAMLKPLPQLPPVEPVSNQTTPNANPENQEYSENITTARSFSETVAEEPAVVETSHLETANEALEHNVELEQQEVYDHAGDVSKDEFFDAASVDALDKGEEAGLQPLELVAAEHELRNALETLTDKMKLLGVHLDAKSVQKINEAKVTVENLLMQSSSKSDAPTVDNHASPMGENNEVNHWDKRHIADGTAKDLIRSMEGMERVLVAGTVDCGIAEVIVDDSEMNDKENSSSELIARDSEILFHLLNTVGLPKKHPDDATAVGNVVERTDKVAAVAAEEAATGPVDLKKKFHEIRAKFNERQQRVGYSKAFGGKETTAAHSNRHFKKAPPPPPTTNEPDAKGPRDSGSFVVDLKGVECSLSNQGEARNMT